MKTIPNVFQKPLNAVASLAKTLAIFLALGALLCGSAAQAANIVLVSDNPNTNLLGAVALWSTTPTAGSADDSLVSFLQSAGHNIVRFSPNDTNTVAFAQADIDALNTNDLVIIGRAAGSGEFQSPAGDVWNTSITKPLICQNAYLARGTRMGWFSNDNLGDGPIMALTAANITDPTNAYLFGSTAMNGAIMAGNYNFALGLNTSQINTNNPIMPSGKILARGNNTNIVIAEFPAGSAVKFGTNILAGYRLYFASGNRENGISIAAGAGSNDLTTAGQAVFLRAVNLALANGVPPNLGLAPTITLQPTNTAVCVGLPLTLVGAAAGEDPLSYQWYLNGTTPVAAGTNATLSIASFQATDAGNYTLVVTNVVNAVTSSVAVVSISGTGTVVNAIANQTVCPGTPLTINAVATGSGTLTYTWRKGATVVQDPLVLNSASYVLTASATLADAGAYSVTVVGDCNTVSNNFTITVINTPVITAQPVSQATPMGNGAVFTVTATAATNVIYQWQTNGVNISDGPGVIGSATSRLAISNLSLTMDGTQVRVVVSDCAGSLNSSTVTLSVTPVFGISFDFDTPLQFTNLPYYLTWNNWINNSFVNPPVALFESPVGGVGPFPGSGSLDMIPANGTDNTSILLPTSFDFSLPGKTLFASTMFKIKTPANATRRATQFGFVTQTNLGINDTTPQSFMTVILQSGATTPTFDLRTQRRSSGGGLQESTNFVAPLTLIVSNWYKMTIAFTNTVNLGASNFSIFCSLQDMGKSGSSNGSVVASFSTTTNIADLVLFKNLYLAFRSFEDGGVENRDNTYAWTTPGNIFFVQPPQSQTVLQGRRTQFKAMVDGEGPYSYQWQKSVDGGANFADIPGARSWNYIVPSVLLSDTASQYRVVVTGPANIITSDPATLTVTSLELAVVSAGSVDGTTVGVMFNQPVSPATAENPANYSINGTAPVAARIYRTSLGALGPEGIYVVLTPASVLTDGFTVTVSGMQDLSGGAVGAANSASSTVAGLIGYDINPLVTAPSGENYSFGPGQFIVTGGGVDIFSGFDAFRYVYTTQTGDFDVKVRIPYMDAVRYTAKGGIDARMSLHPASPGAMAAFDPGPIGEQANGLRQYTEGTAKLTFGAGGTSWGNNTRLFHPDVWLRFRRVGNTFMRYSSTNGVNWLFDGQTQPFINYPAPSTVYLGLGVCSARNTQPESVQFENYGPFAGYSGALIAIGTQPTNITVAAGAAATIGGLVATASGGGIPASAGELAYVWQRNDGSGNFTNMPAAGVTNNLLSVGTVWGTDNGAQYRAIVMASGALSVTSSVATLTVTDTAVPTIASVGVGNIGLLPTYPVSDVVITFSELVSAATATNTANYTVTNSAGVKLTVLSATFLGADMKVIVLKVDGELGTGNSTVGLSGIKDLNNNNLAAAVRTFRTFAAPVGPVVVEVFQDIGAATAITGLTQTNLFTNNQPTWIVYSNTFGFNVVNAFTSSQDNYGVKAYTYFVPPTNGTYKFWIRCDDAGQLWMNTNGTDPAGKVLIAANTGANNNYTVGTTPASSITNITLVAGQSYYMEFLVKEATGGDGFSVMWTAPTVNTAPATTVLMPVTALAYPTAAATPTPVVTEIYTGYNNFITGYNLLAGLTAATNFPTSTYALETVNFKYIAGLPDATVHQKYFATQPSLYNTRFDNYLGRMLSFFVPPSNGLYKFYIRSDDASQLYMNTNAVNSTDPAGKVLLGRVDAYTGAYTLAGQNISLVGGQKYYIEGLWREGGGGDGMAVAVRAQGDGGTPSIGVGTPPGPVEVIPASMLAYPTGYGRAGAVNFVGFAPASPTVKDGDSLVLLPSGVSGSPPYGGYIWYKDGVKVLENVFTNYTPPLTMADNGSVYTLVVTNYFGSVSRSVAVTVLPDAQKPQVAYAVGWRYNDGFTIAYTELMDAASATYLGNYQANNGLKILSATLDPTRQIVSFRTAPQTPGTTYTITINGVKDASSSANAILASTSVHFTTWSVGGNGVMVELFTNIQGGAVADLTGTPKFIENLPDVVYYTNVFASGQFGANTGLETYGARITGYFVPTNTGLYRFYARSDDASQLWMNINNADSENPAGRTMLIHVPGANQNINAPNAQSAPIPLNAGQRYYMEALMKEGTGGDYFQMTFRVCDVNGISLSGPPADNSVAENIGAAFFGGVPASPDLFQVVSSPPTDVTVKELERVTLGIFGYGLPIFTGRPVFQWQKYDSVSLTFTNLPGETRSNMTMTAYMSDNNNQVRVQVQVGGITNNYVTTLHVTPNTDEPKIVSVNSLDGQSITVVYNLAVDTGYATDPGNYSWDPDQFDGLATGGGFMPDDRTVVFPLTPEGYRTESIFQLYVFNMYSAAAVPFAGSSSAEGHVEFLTPTYVGNPLAQGAGTYAAGLYNSTAAILTPFSYGSAFNPGNFTWNAPISPTNGSAKVSASGWDIWNANDAFQFNYRQVVGDFDIKVRVSEFIGADQWSKAGLMARPTLSSNGTFVAMGTTPATTPIASQAPINQYSFQYRDAVGSNATPAQANVNSTVAPTYPNAWLRLQRAGNTFNGYFSSNNVDWVLLTSKDTIYSMSGPFPSTLYVGLATSSHDQTRGLSNNAVATYNDLYFPLAPKITAQPQPAVVVTGLQQNVTFSGVAATGDGPFTYQWRKNGLALPGKTSATLTIPSTSVADSGTYELLVGNNGGNTVSAPAVLTVTNTPPSVVSESRALLQNGSFTAPVADLLVNDTDLEGHPLTLVPFTWSSQFDQGLPPGTALYGMAHIDGAGGSDGGGLLKLNDAIGSASGSFLITNPIVPNGLPVVAMSASFKGLVAFGSGDPADGFSFNWASDLPDAATGASAAEDGLGSGLSVGFDNYPAAGPGAPSIKIRWGGALIATNLIAKLNNTNWFAVNINVSQDGKLDVLLNGIPIYSQFQLPGYTKLTGRVGFYGRTGGQFQVNWIDDVNITVFSYQTALGGVTTLTNGVLNYTSGLNKCGLDTVYYLVSDGQQNGTVLDSVNVTVVENPAVPPTILACVTNQNVAVDPTNCLATVPDLRGQLQVNDSCSGLALYQDPAPGSTIALGAHTVTFTVVDTANLSNTCTATLTAIDSTPPTLTCPAPITMVTSAGGQATLPNLTGLTTASEGCSLPAIVTQNPPAGTLVPPGVTNVVFTATDGAGNTATCSVTVTVVVPISISVGGGGFLLNWASNMPPVVLQSTTNLNPPIVWTDLVPQPTPVQQPDGSYTVGLPTTPEPQTYYRVKAP